MAGDDTPDKIIREREFKLPSGIDIRNLQFSTEEETEEVFDVESEDMDDAIGDIFDPFSEPSGDFTGHD